MANDRKPAGGLTRRAVDSYVKENGVRCPFCGGTEGLQPTGHPARLPAYMIYPVVQHLDCLACGRKWTELYRLANIEERGV